MIFYVLIISPITGKIEPHAKLWVALKDLSSYSGNPDVKICYDDVNGEEVCEGEERKPLCETAPPHFY